MLKIGVTGTIAIRVRMDFLFVIVELLTHFHIPR